MTSNDRIFLECLAHAVEGSTLPADLNLKSEDWEYILNLARKQEVLPLIFDAVCKQKSFRKMERSVRRKYHEKALALAVRQVTQSNEFLTILLHAQEMGLDPIVLKGIGIRNLYPMPMLRPSCDEDLLIKPEELPKYHEFLLSEGLTADEPDAVGTSMELSYHRANSPTYIELHTSPFDLNSEAYNDCNALFEGAMDRAIRIQIQDVSLRTLAPTDHLLFLICHAYKHFLHSGVGIRQVCDIGMFTKAYERDLDWKRIVASCESIRIETFTAAIYQILNKYLGFDMPDTFSGIEVDETDLLEDILSDGTYGTEDPNRVRSSTITLEAVAADRAKRKRRGILHSVFLPRKNLAGRYPYLRKYPFLLPLAWGSRIKTYAVQRFSMKVDPSESIRIGRERIAILRKYRVID